MHFASAGMEINERHLPAWRIDLQIPASHRYRQDCELHVRACVMNQPGGTRGTDGQGRDLVWFVLFLLAALVGGFAAADLRHVSTVKAVAVSVLVAVVVTLVVHYALPRSARDDARPVGQPKSSSGIEGSKGQAPGGRRPDHSTRPAANQVAVVRLMEPQKPVTKPWWNSGEPTPTAGAASSRSPGHLGPVGLPGLSAGRPVPELRLFPHGHRPDRTGMAFPLPGMPADMGLAARRSLARDPGSAALAQ